MQSKEELDCHSGWLACLRKNFDRRYVRPRLLQFNGCAYTHEKVASKEFAMYYSMCCSMMQNIEEYITGSHHASSTSCKACRRSGGRKHWEDQCHNYRSCVNHQPIGRMIPKVSSRCISRLSAEHPRPLRWPQSFLEVVAAEFTERVDAPFLVYIDSPETFTTGCTGTSPVVGRQHLILESPPSWST